MGRAIASWCARGFLLLPLVLVVSGCSEAEAQKEPKQEMSLPVAFVDKEGWVQSELNRPADISLFLGGIGGAFYGPSPTIQMIPIGQQTEIKIDLDSLETQLNALAVKLKQPADQRFLVVDPADTRFARVGVMLSKTIWMSGKYSAGFMNPETGNTYLLMWFDRPCHITGKLIENLGYGKAVGTVDLTINERGFTWVGKKSSKPYVNAYEVLPKEVDAIILVAPEQAAKDGIPLEP